MEFVAGETLGGRIVRDPRFAEVRPKLARQCGEILARIHAIPASAAPHLKQSTAAELVDQWRAAYLATDWPRPGVRPGVPLAGRTPAAAAGSGRGWCTATSGTAT